MAGYFDPLLRFVDRMVDQGFLAAEPRSMLTVDDDPLRLLATLRDAARRADGEDDFSQI